MTDAAQRRSKIMHMLAEKRKEKRLMDKEREGSGSGRRLKPVQQAKDKLNNEIARLERGLLPGEAEPPPPPTMAALAAAAASAPRGPLVCINT